MSRGVRALTLAAALACGGSDSTDPGGGGGAEDTCTVILAGAETGSPACSNLSTDKNDSEDKTSKATSSGAGLTAYQVHGTFTGTVIPAITETTIGPVTINATF